MLTNFIRKLNALKPDREKMINEGYREERINEIYKKQFDLVPRKETVKVDTLIEDFIYNYKLNTNFRIHNLTFSNDLEEEIIDNHIIIGSILGGYLSYERSSNKFYACYADDIENSIELLCEGDENFFEVLLVVAEYSSKAHEGLLLDEEDVSEEELEQELERYIEKCDVIFPYGCYNRLFE